MNAVSKVVESIVDNGKRIMKLLRYGDIDNINTYQFGPFGEDSNVPADYRALFAKTSNSSEPICIGFLNKIFFEDLAAGEKALFATNEAGDELVNKIVFRNTGAIEINKDLDGVQILINEDGSLGIITTGNVTIDIDGNAGITASGDVSVSADGNATIDATQFNVNSGNLTVD